MRERLRKTRGVKMQDSLTMLLKTHGEKMSLFYPETMFMKTNHLTSVSNDLPEKKESYKLDGVTYAASVCRVAAVTGPRRTKLGNAYRIKNILSPSGAGETFLGAAVIHGWLAVG